jgi:hypothetical protein
VFPEVGQVGHLLREHHANILRGFSGILGAHSGTLVPFCSAQGDARRNCRVRETQILRVLVGRSGGIRTHDPQSPRLVDMLPSVLTCPILSLAN